MGKEGGSRAVVYCTLDGLLFNWSVCIGALAFFVLCIDLNMRCRYFMHLLVGRTVWEESDAGIKPRW